MDYTRIIYKPGKVTQIIMNRPQYMNAISAPMYKELEDAFDRAVADPECRVIVHSGAGRCFSIGQDAFGLTPESAPMLADGRPVEELVKQYGSQGAAHTEWIRQHHYYGFEMKLKKWRHIPKPTIAMVHGYCIYDGFGSAAAMDIVFASEDALFLPESADGALHFGPRKAMEVYYEHRLMPARECYESHFVSRIYPTRDILEKETLAFAERVADSPEGSMTVGHTKEELLDIMDVQGFKIMAEYAESHTLGALRIVPEKERQIVEEKEKEWLKSLGL